MPYSDFSIKKTQEIFQIEIIEKPGIFSKIAAVPISQHLAETLSENVPLGTSINTEKARSELIISPILVEVRKILNHKISLFSGIEFNVDKEKDLSGFCDFIISLSSEQLFLKSPVIAIVEAKNENIMGGLGQCIAEMIASKIFNERENTKISKTYGAVTSGNIWKFIKMEDNTVHLDLDDYGINKPDQIIGILSAMIKQEA